MLSVCITVKNRSRVRTHRHELALFPNCLRSLAESVGKHDAEIVIADWHSDDWPLSEWVRDLLPSRDTKIIEVDGDFSRGRGRNSAAAAASSENLAFFDADMLVRPTLIEDLLDALHKGKAYFPICWSFSSAMHRSGFWRTTGFGNCAMSRKVFDTVGGWPEYSRWGGEDTDLYRKIRQIAPVVRRRHRGLLHQWHPNELEWKDRYSGKHAIEGDGTAEEAVVDTSTVALPELPDPLGVTSIVIVTRNQWQYTDQCIRSIREATTVPYELVFVDNHSTDGTVSCLPRSDDATIIANEDNRGFPAAANQGIRAASGEYVVLLNNDTIVTRGWLRRLLCALHSNPQNELVGPVSNRVDGQQRIRVGYRSLAQIDGFAQEWAERNEMQTVNCNRLIGFCLLFRRSLVDRIGYLDERFGIGNFDDDDFTRRTVNAGYRACIARDAFVHHFGGMTFRSEGIDKKVLIDQNRQLFQEKWVELG